MSPLKNWRVLEGLPELPPVVVSGAVGDPVTIGQLEGLLSYVSPDQEYPVWRDIVAAIRNSPADEEALLDLALRWSRGEVGEQGTPARYTGDDATIQVWNTMPPKEGGVGVGTIYSHAKEGGYVGPAYGTAPPVTSAFANFAPPAPDAWRTGNDTMKATAPPLEELIDGWIEKGIVNFLNARGGSNKSRLALQIGLCIDAGRSVFGRATEQATFVYLSWEDHPFEVTRRIHMITRKLKIDNLPTMRWRDFTKTPSPLAVVADYAEPTPLYSEVRDYLKAIPGHKFLVLDSTYDAIYMPGNAKINEGSVVAAIAFLQQICYETDSTILTLFHPSQAGIQRGDASGYGEAWHNKPRARSSLTAVKGLSGVYDLKIEKRNNGPRPERPIHTLHWTEGCLLPISDIETKEQDEIFRKACLQAAAEAAEAGTPVQKIKHADTWVLEYVQQQAGRKPSQPELKDALNQAVRDGLLYYAKGSRDTTAGYYPVEKFTAASEETE